MTDRKFKYNGSEYHKVALLCAIGQLAEVSDKWVSISDVIGFLGVSKPTAIKIVKGLARDRLILLNKVDYRKNSYKYIFVLTLTTMDKYINGDYDKYYKSYRDDMLLAGGFYRG